MYLMGLLHGFLAGILLCLLLYLVENKKELKEFTRRLERIQRRDKQ